MDEGGRSTLNRHINNFLCHLHRAVLALGHPDYNYSTSELSASSLRTPSREDSNPEMHGIIKEAQKPRYTWGQDNTQIGIAVGCHFLRLLQYFALVDDMRSKEDLRWIG